MAEGTGAGWLEMAGGNNEDKQAKDKQVMEEKSRLVWILSVAGAVLWAFAVYFNYYLVHKPFNVVAVTALVSVLLDVAIWLGILSVALALGRRCSAWLNHERAQYDSPLEEFIFSLGLGLGLLSLIVLALGLAGLFYRWLFWLLLVAALILFRRHIRPFPGPIPRLEGRLGWFLALYLAATLILAFLSTLTPPTAWDSQVYHLTGPRLYVQHHRIVGGIDIPYLGFPALVETLFAAALLLKGPVVAKLIHFAYGALTLLALYAFARRYFNLKVGWLAMAIFYAVPSVVLVSTWAYVDAALIFYEFAAFYALCRWLDHGQVPGASKVPGTSGTRWLLLCALFCGLAMGIKYTGFALSFSLGLIVLWRVRLRCLALPKCQAPIVALFGVTALLVASPWYLRNLVFTGNPFYPFFFGGTNWDGFRAWFYSRAGTGLAYTAPWRLLIAPWEMTILGVEGREGYEATIGPVLLMVVPMLALVWRKLPGQDRSLLRRALLVCLVQYLFWLLAVAQSALLTQTRLLFPIFALLVLLAAYTLDRLALMTRPAFSLQWVVVTMLLLALGLNLVSSALTFMGDSPLPYLAGWESQDSYLKRHLGSYHQMITYINEELPFSARILFLWEPRSYYCQRACQPDAILDGFLHLVYRFQDAQGIIRYLREQGFTHVLLHKRGLGFILEAQFDPVTEVEVGILETLQERHLRLIHRQGDDYLLYELRGE